MFWETFVLKVDKIKNYLQKIPAKQLPACAFRAVAKLKKLRKRLIFDTILLTFPRN